MGTLEMPIVGSRAGTDEMGPNRVLEVRPEDTTISAVCAGGATFALSRLLGSHVRKGDALLVARESDSAAGAKEVLIRKPALKHADLYHARVGYAAQPKPDRRSEMFVRVEVVGGQLGIHAIHIPCYVIRDSSSRLIASSPGTLRSPCTVFCACRAMRHSANCGSGSESAAWNSS